MRANLARGTAGTEGGGSDAAASAAALVDRALRSRPA
jgi:hypothetical protein